MSSFPGITVRILDQSLTTSASELNSPTIGGLISKDGLDRFVYDATETAQGYYYVSDLADWFSRLTNWSNTVGHIGFSATNGVTAIAANLATNGATGWTDEWYAVHNFLQYGAPCYITWQGSGASADFKLLDIDVAFQGGSGAGYKSLVNDIVNARADTDRPVFGVISIPSDTTITGSMTIGGPSDGNNACAVFGEKKHFNVAGSATNIIRTTLAADVAGCIARTDRDYYPWYSPAGSRRGIINNAVGLAKNLNDSEKALLYSSKLNPVINIPGEGTLLFGDKSLSSSSSSLTSIGVARLFIYLKKTISPLARGVLFEQNNDITRSSFRTAADSLLSGLVASNGISEYRIICDTTNNTPEIIEAKNFVADILVKPIPSVNFVRITFTNADLSVTF